MTLLNWSIRPWHLHGQTTGQGPREVGGHRCGAADVLLRGGLWPGSAAGKTWGPCDLEPTSTDCVWAEAGASLFSWLPSGDTHPTEEQPGLEALPRSGRAPTMLPSVDSPFQVSPARGQLVWGLWQGWNTDAEHPLASGTLAEKPGRGRRWMRPRRTPSLPASRSVFWGGPCPQVALDEGGTQGSPTALSAAGPTHSRTGASTGAAEPLTHVALTILTVTPGRRCSASVPLYR